ncbi:MAG TPA: putative manganese transporter [Candidatus Pelethenecus sp.]|nr:putative manganese transporter [Candidatus Pelethenecus sp.]
MLDILLDSFLDSLKVFGIAFLFYLNFSFLNEKITSGFKKHPAISPLIGASCGLIPQCGISVVAADMYQKKQISRGTILAIFFACSDEALFILASDKDKVIYLLPLLVIKFVFALLLGYTVDMLYRKRENIEVSSDLKMDCCEHHHHEEQKILGHILHAFHHCFKIFLYVFIVNLCMGMLVYFIGELAILQFLGQNEALGPVFAVLIGLIPNCASSILMSELFIINGLSFGALVAGLSVNAGLGFIYLFKYKAQRIETLKLIGILFFYALGIGYLIYLIMRGF